MLLFSHHDDKRYTSVLYDVSLLLLIRSGTVVSSAKLLMRFDGEEVEKSCVYREQWAEHTSSVVSEELGGSVQFVRVHNPVE